MRRQGKEAKPKDKKSSLLWHKFSTSLRRSTSEGAIVSPSPRNSPSHEHQTPANTNSSHDPPNFKLNTEAPSSNSDSSPPLKIKERSSRIPQPSSTKSYSTRSTAHTSTTPSSLPVSSTSSLPPKLPTTGEATRISTLGPDRFMGPAADEKPNFTEIPSSPSVEEAPPDANVILLQRDLKAMMIQMERDMSAEKASWGCAKKTREDEEIKKLVERGGWRSKAWTLLEEVQSYHTQLLDGDIIQLEEDLRDTSYLDVRRRANELELDNLEVCIDLVRGAILYVDRDQLGMYLVDEYKLGNFRGLAEAVIKYGMGLGTLLTRLTQIPVERKRASSFASSTLSATNSLLAPAQKSNRGSPRADSLEIDQEPPSLSMESPDQHTGLRHVVLLRYRGISAIALAMEETPPNTIKFTNPAFKAESEALADWIADRIDSQDEIDGKGKGPPRNPKLQKLSLHVLHVVARHAMATLSRYPTDKNVQKLWLPVLMTWGKDLIDTLISQGEWSPEDVLLGTKPQNTSFDCLDLSAEPASRSDGLRLYVKLKAHTFDAEEAERERGTLGKSLPLIGMEITSTGGEKIRGRDKIVNSSNLTFHHQACQIAHFRFALSEFRLRMKAAGEKPEEIFRDEEEEEVEAVSADSRDVWQEFNVDLIERFYGEDSSAISFTSSPPTTPSEKSLKYSEYLSNCQEERILSMETQAGVLADDNERVTSARHLTHLQSDIDTLVSSHTHMLPQHDPFINHTQVSNQLEKQVIKENESQASLLRFQQQQPSFEAGVASSIQSARRMYENAYALKKQDIEVVEKQVREALQSVAPAAEYNFYCSTLGAVPDPNTPYQNVDAITFPGSNHASTASIKEGTLERKKRFTKSYKESYYVLTPSGYLHERKSNEDVNDIVSSFSLFLPKCSLGPPAKESDKSHKFHVKGNKAVKSSSESRAKTSFRFGGKETTYSLRARTHHEMLQWWNEIDKLSRDTKTSLSAAGTEKRVVVDPVQDAVRNVGYEAPTPGVEPIREEHVTVIHTTNATFEPVRQS